MYLLVSFHLLLVRIFSNLILSHLTVTIIYGNSPVLLSTFIKFIAEVVMKLGYGVTSMKRAKKVK